MYFLQYLQNYSKLSTHFEKKILCHAFKVLGPKSYYINLNYTSYCRHQLQALGQFQTDWHRNPAPGRTRSPHQQAAVSEPKPSRREAYSACTKHDEQKWPRILLSCVQYQTHLSQRITLLYDFRNSIYRVKRHRTYKLLLVV